MTRSQNPQNRNQWIVALANARKHASREGADPALAAFLITRLEPAAGGWEPLMAATAEVETSVRAAHREVRSRRLALMGAGRQLSGTTRDAAGRVDTPLITRLLGGWVMSDVTAAPWLPALHRCRSLVASARAEPGLGLDPQKVEAFAQATEALALAHDTLEGVNLRKREVVARLAAAEATLRDAYFAYLSVVKGYEGKAGLAALPWFRGTSRRRAQGDAPASRADGSASTGKASPSPAAPSVPAATPVSPATAASEAAAPATADSSPATLTAPTPVPAPVAALAIPTADGSGGDTAAPLATPAPTAA